MTRDDAVKVAMGNFLFNHPSQTWSFSPIGLIDTLLALGMLKLDEPKSAREKFIARMKAYNYGDASCGMKDALGAFDYALGLQTGVNTA